MGIKCFSANEILQGVINNIADKSTVKFVFPEGFWVLYNRDFFDYESSADFNSAYLIEKNDKQFLIAYAEIKDRGDTTSILISTDFTQEPYCVDVERRLNGLDLKNKSGFRDSFIKRIGGDPNEPTIKAKLLIEELDFEESVIIGTSKNGGFCYSKMFRFLKAYGLIRNYDEYAIESSGYVADLIDFFPNNPKYPKIYS